MTELIRRPPRPGGCRSRGEVDDRPDAQSSRSAAQGLATTGALGSSYRPTTKKTCGGNGMLHHACRLVLALLASFVVCMGSLPASAADPEIDKLLQSPVAKDWVTNGGNM